MNLQEEWHKGLNAATLIFQEEWHKGLNAATLIFFADVFMIVVWLWLIPALNSFTTAVNASHP